MVGDKLSCGCSTPWRSTRVREKGQTNIARADGSRLVNASALALPQYLLLLSLGRGHAACTPGLHGEEGCHSSTCRSHRQVAPSLAVPRTCP